MVGLILGQFDPLGPKQVDRPLEGFRTGLRLLELLLDLGYGQKAALAASPQKLLDQTFDVVAHSDAPQFRRSCSKAITRRSMSEWVCDVGSSRAISCLSSSISPSIALLRALASTSSGILGQRTRIQGETLEQFVVVQTRDVERHPREPSKIAAGATDFECLSQSAFREQLGADVLIGNLGRVGKDHPQAVPAGSGSDASTFSTAAA